MIAYVVLQEKCLPVPNTLEHAEAYALALDMSGKNLLTKGEINK